ncbi:hypothetical protein C0V97_12350 [Asaia sp. W19]|uniref:endonuclease VII domain-containing protein n=1 Tax=unclassified Asaia TaxID=2685023 RepID=UPI000F8F16AA|nr:hypothetical protein C0V97_18510 [Asaia sp. W19]RUT25367.1 hypothetical protein C0V97_12350 [Asaia sp. W19]
MTRRSKRDPLKSLKDTLRRYGLTIPDYHQKLKAQHYGCAICGQSDFGGLRLSIDHDHQTGAVRGLLCSRCNVGLGHFSDNPEVLIKAADYLIQHEI